MIKESDLVRALAEQVGLEFVDLADFPIDPMATSLLPEALARRYRALPIGERDGQLLVAMSDPANVYALDDIRTITGATSSRSSPPPNDVEAAIQKYGGMDSPGRGDGEHRRGVGRATTRKPTSTSPSRTRRSSGS